VAVGHWKKGVRPDTPLPMAERHAIPRKVIRVLFSLFTVFKETSCIQFNAILVSPRLPTPRLV